jgi:hypothetical protein
LSLSRLNSHPDQSTATRVEGGRPGISDTWKSTAPSAAPGDEAPPAEAPAAGSTDGGTAAGGEAEPAQGPGPAVTAEAAGNVLAIAQAGEALAAGDLPAAQAALEAAWKPPGSRPRPRAAMTLLACPVARAARRPASLM